MDIHEVSDLADYFILCNGTSDRMLAALGEAVVEKVKAQYSLRAKPEGQPQDGWLLLDFGDVIVHLFSPDRRDYYRLEELWSKGKVIVRLQ